MKIEIKPGTYVVAVSGGVDSMVLLDLLAKRPGLKLVVAHFDHSIRKNSVIDRQLVQRAAASYNLPFVFDNGLLSTGASEARARAARYKFLQKVKSAAGARAIVTAHHQDDVIETAIINLWRGTNRRGLTALKSQADIIRPLLNVSKKTLIKYAEANHITWNEDETNQEIKYLRNFIRNQLLPKLSQTDKNKFIAHLDNMSRLNRDIDKSITDVLATLAKDRKLLRQEFINLPHNLARELMASWLRANAVNSVDKKKLELLVRAAKVFTPGRQIDINKEYAIRVGSNELALVRHER